MDSTLNFGKRDGAAHLGSNNETLSFSGFRDKVAIEKEQDQRKIYQEKRDNDKNNMNNKQKEGKRYNFDNLKIANIFGRKFNEINKNKEHKPNTPSGIRSRKAFDQSSPAIEDNRHHLKEQNQSARSHAEMAPWQNAFFNTNLMQTGQVSVAQVMRKLLLLMMPFRECDYTRSVRSIEKGTGVVQAPPHEDKHAVDTLLMLVFNVLSVLPWQIECSSGFVNSPLYPHAPIEYSLGCFYGWCYLSLFVNCYAFVQALAMQCFSGFMARNENVTSIQLLLSYRWVYIFLLKAFEMLKSFDVISIQWYYIVLFQVIVAYVFFMYNSIADRLADYKERELAPATTKSMICILIDTAIVYQQWIYNGP